eukprot:7380502-Prymnesium_polylepis.1
MQHRRHWMREKAAPRATGAQDSGWSCKSSIPMSRRRLNRCTCRRQNHAAGTGGPSTCSRRAAR